MATGRLGTADITGVTYTDLYTVPADTFAVASLSMVNRTASAIQVRVAITTVTGGSAPNNEDFIEYGTTIAANGVLERTGLVIDAGKKISVYASQNGISALAMGIETATV